MRIVEMVWNEDEEKFEYEDDDTVAVARWKTPAGIMLEILDDQLTTFGLEIVQYDSGSDDHIWRIERRAVGRDALTKVVPFEE